MRARTWLALLLTLGVAAPAAAQGTTAGACPPATSNAARGALWTAVRDTLQSELRDAARAAGVAEPAGIVFASMWNRESGAARVWSFRANVPDSLSRAVILRRARLLACLPEREVIVSMRLDPSGFPPGTAVERMPSVQNPRALASALDRISRSADPLNRTPLVTVHVRMLVTRDGEVAHAELVRNTTHPDVDRAILEAARGLRFRPARVGNVPVDVWVEQPVEVRLGG
ncbi:MAG TPA: energy transducer TonB [Longimicrobium sp.]|nr:energy transducer TonB [Longimicrobium sp.]